MSTTTNNLKLYKVNPSTDGNDKFSFQRFLNDNWDKLDTDSYVKDRRIDEVEAAVENIGGGSVFYTSYHGRGGSGLSNPTTVRAPLVNGQKVLPTTVKFLDQHGSCLEFGGTLSWVDGWTHVSYVLSEYIIKIMARITQDSNGYVVQLYDPAGYASQQFSANGEVYWCVFTFGERFE